jgi:Dyp-type peroxidase family
MAWLKWFEKVNAAQAEAQAESLAHKPLDAFDFDSLVNKNWMFQRLSRTVFRTLLPIVFAFLRTFWPVACFGRLVLISRYEDVKTVLSNSQGAFPVVYGPEMQELGGGVQGVLGLDGPDHDQLRSSIWNQLGDRDLLENDLIRIRKCTQDIANALLDAGGGEIDVCRDLITRTATEVCCRYMGLDPHDPDAFGEWGIALSMLLFGDPTGDPTIGKQGRIGAAHLHSLIDDAIDRTKRNEYRHEYAAKPDAEKVTFRANATLLYRLLIIEKMDAKLVRATIIGLATGFVPTNTLAAGNILEELLKKPRLMERAKAAALTLAETRKSGDEASEKAALHDLESVLLQAARRNPALSPGIWRWSPDGGEILRERGSPARIRSGSIMLVSILSALRDRRMPLDERRDPHKAAALIFGYGPHDCMGAQMALVQITEVFAALLARPDVQLAEGKAGRMLRAGPFPVQCKMTYRHPTAKRALMVIALPVREGVARKDVEEALDKVGNPMHAEYAKTLTDTGIVSFASINVIEQDAGSDASILIVEINGDGDEQVVLHKLALASLAWLSPILAFCTADGHQPATADEAAELLYSGIHHLHRKPWGATGLHFDGLSELSTKDIDRQHRLFVAARTLVDLYLGKNGKLHRGMRAMQVLNRIRRTLKGDPYLELPEEYKELMESLDADLRTAIVRPSRKRLNIADWQPPKTIYQPLGPMLRATDSRAFVVSFLLTWVLSGYSLLRWLNPEGFTSFFGTLGQWRDAVEIKLLLLERLLVEGKFVAVGHWFWNALLGLPSALLSLLSGIYTHNWEISTLLVGGLATAFLIFAALAGLFVLLIRCKERTDISDERIADYGHVRQIAAKEDARGIEQNHIIAVMPLKPGLIRKLSFAFVMWGIKQTVTYWFRPGFVLTMGTIHKARWFRVKGTKQFVFLSNYDGSWESYLEDFITRAHEGQTAAWSHGVGFPPTSYLVLDGAKDGDRFKRWVRGQQRVTRVWYSRFPELTMKQIHRNAMIEDGLARAANDTDARRWLSNFGSAQREVMELETFEAQSLIFSGFGKKLYASTLLLRLPEDRERLAEWLKSVSDYPDNPNGGNMPPGRISFGEVSEVEPALVVGFTAAGLEKAGLVEGEGLEELPAVFRMGMRGRHRILGDDLSRQWRWSDANEADLPEDETRRVEAALVIYHNEPASGYDPEHGMAECVRLHRVHMENAGFTVVHHVPCQPVHHKEEGLTLDFEHFGFRDGISQPVIRGTRCAQKAVPERDYVAPGEFLLGYQNDQGYVSPPVTVSPHLDPCSNLPTVAESKPNRFPYFGNRTSNPDARDFGRNGSFLVLRQLDQDVEKFETAMTRTAAKLRKQYPRLSELIGRKVNAEWVSAKIIGRWKNGTALVKSPSCPADAKTPDNDFSYGVDDPRGLACPLGSHIRRTNPRDSLEPGDREEQQITNRHRILRRGRSYEYDAEGTGGIKKGLLFAALCSDLERQFEFVQNNWINARAFHGLTDEADPLLGNPLAEEGSFIGADRRKDEKRPTRFTIPTPVGPVTVKGLQSYVTLKGGGYFFLPSRSAIKHLVNRLYAD